MFGKFVKKNYKKGFQLLEKSLGGNIKEAYFDIAVCYETDKGVQKDTRKAFESYLKNSLIGNKSAIYEVGRCYYHGIGIEKDEQLAAIWLEMGQRN